MGPQLVGVEEPLAARLAREGLLVAVRAHAVGLEVAQVGEAAIAGGALVGSVAGVDPSGMLKKYFFGPSHLTVNMFLNVKEMKRRKERGKRDRESEGAKH